uniref:Uncharacterized protein n=1 Tax=Megaselia scalaris TaxID=36166 RepID=T1GQ59_MEGSC
MRLTKERDSIQNKWIGYLTMASENDGSSGNGPSQSNQSTPMSSSSVGLASSSSTPQSSERAAGSRRTVYLIDENQKLPETRSSGNTPEPQTPKNNNCNSSNGSSGSNSLTNNNSSSANNTPAAVTESPSTFLMYNRINTMISSGNSPTDPNGSNTSLTGNILNSTANPVDDKLLRKKQEEKSSSIWYEYGCV